MAYVSISVEGGLFPSDLLDRIAAGEAKLPGQKAAEASVLSVVFRGGLHNQLFNLLSSWTMPCWSASGLAAKYDHGQAGHGQGCQYQYQRWPY